MSSAASYSPQRKTSHAPSWWSSFSRGHQRRLEDEIAIYRDLESALATKRQATNVQEKPGPSTKVSSPQIRAPRSPAASAEKRASGPSDNALAEAPKESPSTFTRETVYKESERNKKQDKPAKANRSNSDRDKPDQLPAEKRTERKSDEAAHKQQCSERNNNSPTTKGTRKVQFAVGTKKGASSSMAYSSSPNSSKDSYVDAPSTPRSTRATGPKPILKKRGSSGFKEPAKKDSVQPVVPDIDFDDFWSDDSDRASAVDVNEIPATVRPRGILKNRNPYARRSIDGVKSSQKSKLHGSSVSQHKSTRGRNPPHNLTFQDREQAKLSNSGPAAFGRGERLPSRTKRMSSTRRQGDDVWHGVNEYESTTDYPHYRSRSQAKAQDVRVNHALRQASYNSKVNSRSPSDSTSTPRSSHGRNARPGLGDDYQRRSNSVGPVFVFRASDAAMDEPDLIVSNQADLDAARREYRRHRKSSMSASGLHRGRHMETQAKRDRRRVSYYKADAGSETRSESEGSDD
ncbi:MAG: hypothetical protein Q9191_001955 [Dirinaria sp. TL-2023a]